MNPPRTALAPAAAAGIVALAGPLLFLATTSAPGAATVEQPALQRGPSERAMRRCYPVESRVAHEETVVTVTVFVTPEGRVTSVRSPPGTPDHLARAAECIGPELRFEPARVDGRPAAAEVTLPLDFGLSYRGEDRPPEVFEPTLRTSKAGAQAALRKCYPEDFFGVGEVRVAAVVTTEGRARDMTVASGSGRPEVDDIALCIMEKLRFRPARRGSEPVDAEVEWSIKVFPP